MIVGWNSDALSWSIYHWDNKYDGAVEQLEYQKSRCPGIQFSILVNISHYKTHEKRDELLELINALNP